MSLNRVTAQTFSCLAVIFAVILSTNLTAAAQEDLTGVKCIVNSEKAASLESFVEYKEAKVFFCCDHCADTFREDLKLKDKSKFAAKANHQLVLTGQFVQQGCPTSGKDVVDGLIATVGTIKVGFCCAGCCDKVKNTEDVETKANLVFAAVPFKKGFHKKPAAIALTDVKCILMPNKNVVEKQSVEYNAGKVFFCCGGCAKKFAAAPDTFAAKANHQLVATGQFVQTGCPISGGDVDDEQSSVVGGVTVKFCCDKCKSKVDGADEDAKVELVFGSKRFSKAFAKQ